MRIDIILASITGRICLATAFVFPVLNNIHLALLMLLGAFIADFFTGWLATYMEIKRGEKPLPPSGRSFESKRARESVIKGLAYILIILGSTAIEYLFFNRKFEFTNLSNRSLGVTELVIGFCFAIELYSTLVENMKRAGFDIIGKVSSIADAGWKLFDKIKRK